MYRFFLINFVSIKQTVQMLFKVRIIILKMKKSTSFGTSGHETKIPYFL
jgi:hypothetical protein